MGGQRAARGRVIRRENHDVLCTRALVFTKTEFSPSCRKAGSIQADGDSEVSVRAVLLSRRACAGGVVFCVLRLCCLNGSFCASLPPLGDARSVTSAEPAGGLACAACPQLSDLTSSVSTRVSCGERTLYKT